METQKTNSVPVPSDEEFVEVRKPTSLLIAQFFLFPLIIIAICVGIFLLFGYMTYGQTSPGEYLSEIRSGSETQRWHAAFELSNVVASCFKALRLCPEPSNPNSVRSPEFKESLVATYTESPDPDIRVRRFIAVMLAKLGDPAAVPVLVEGLRREERLKTAEWAPGWFRPSVSDIRNDLIESQIYTLFALGSIGDNSAVPVVLEQIENEDASVRKMAAYVLGALKDPRAIPKLSVMLNDVKDDVRWTSALALAQLNNGDGADLLMKLLDYGYVETFPEMTPDDKAALRINAVKGLGILKFAPARNKISALSEDDPVLSVRNAALEALKNF